MKLLIIDDSERIRKALIKSIFLIPQITSVSEAEDVKGSFEIIENFEPDIIIMDLMLKNGTGLDILKNLDTSDESKLIIVYSNFLTPRYISLIKEHGIQNYFDKNSEIIDIIEFIKSKIGY